MKYRRQAVLAAVALFLATGAVWGVVRATRTSDEELLFAARRAFYQGRNQEAVDLARQVLSRRPDWQEALVVAGRSSAQLGYHADAIGYLEQATTQGGFLAVEAAFSAGELHEKLHRASQAEAHYRQVLQLEPGHRAALEHLARLLNITGRRWEAASYMLELVRKGEQNPETLTLLGDMEAILDQHEVLEKMRQAAPNDPLPLLGLARLAFAHEKLPEAEALLRHALQLDAKLIPVHALLGTVLLQRDDQPGLTAWQASLPNAAAAHPQVWLVRGLWARDHNQDRSACRCFWETLRRDPNNAVAHLQLSMLLEPEHASRGHDMLVARIEVLSRLNEKLRWMFPLREKLGEMPDAVAQMSAVASLCEQAGRLWEAWAWNGQILKQSPSDLQALKDFARIGGLLTEGTPQVLTVHNPSAVINLSTYPIPMWPKSAAPDSPTPRRAPSRRR